MRATVHSAEVAAPFDEMHCRREVSRCQKSGQLRYELARGLAANDDPAEAIEHCSEALALEPKLRCAARLLASLLQKYELNAEVDISPYGLRAAFAFVDVDRQALANAAIIYLKARSPLAEALALGRDQNWDAAARFVQAKKGRKLLRDRLFRTALTYGVNTDPEIEFLLTALRRFLLQAPGALKARSNYEFACTLIRQCHNNDYVFFASEDEQALLQNLNIDLEALLAGETGQVADFLRLSLYKPIYEFANSAPTIREFDKVLPRALRPVLEECWGTRNAEAQLATEVPRLTAITDPLSCRVAAQYLEAPYPRWLSLQTPEPGSAATQLGLYFSEEELKFLKETYDVLIAGAGTCQQAISSAIACGPKARVLAFDLSVRSLSYGARMANLLDADNLSFAQGDILQLEELSQRFDIIECCGVLHHMAAPYEAWRGLVNQLRDGGLMNVGLYSAISRTVIREVSATPEWPGADSSDNALRAFRNKILHFPPGKTGAKLKASVDFYAKSGFRDLALHTSEKQCTLPSIGRFLTHNGLEFRGFNLPEETLAAYQERFQEAPVPGTLINWWAFEQEYPDTFNGMYLLWCLKTGDAEHL